MRKGLLDFMNRPSGAVDLAMHRERRWTRRIAVSLGLFAGLAVVLSLDGPGLTVDEPLDVRPGRTYVTILRNRGWHFFDAPTVQRVYRDNAEHPPLGRWLLGIASVLGEPMEVLWKGPDPTGQYVLAGRLAPALAYGVLVGVIGMVAGRRFGSAAGFTAGWSLLAMPRVFAHAHLAALDTFLSLFWTMALLAGESALRCRRLVPAMAGAGAVWALALLTKIHAWFLLPILLLWAVCTMPVRRALVAMLVWAVTGVALFWLGWPWLWYDTWPRLQAYVGTGITRATILVQYFGQIVPDRDVPWHYPWFYFAVTVPAGLQILGARGVLRAWQERRSEPFLLLLAGSIVLFLVVFSTSVPVYDGERLFLHVMPAWAVLIGAGFGSFWSHRLAGARGRMALGAFLLLQSAGVIAVHPFGLSYYNALVGGLKGAERLGLELTFWNDAVDQVLLDRLAREAAPGSTAALVPSLYPGQGILTTNRALARRDIVLKDQEAAADAEWIVLSRREAYWPAQLRRRIEGGGGSVVAARSRQGVWLARLWHFPPSHTAPPVRGGSIGGTLRHDRVPSPGAALGGAAPKDRGNALLPSGSRRDDP
jgi:4-amino-4-deoxy-L-arabinose transferase-like glycosyltransferase